MSTIEFLEAIWPKKLLKDESFELRAVDRQTGKIKRKFCNSILEFIEVCDQQAELKCDIYYGVSTRYMNGGKKRDCFRAGCVWLDLDEPNLPKFEQRPDIIVQSGGGGYHIYWLLNTPIYLHNGAWIELEAINRGICKKYGGDIAAIDASRILRVPGTLNYKYTPPKIVSIHAI